MSPTYLLDTTVLVAREFGIKVDLDDTMLSIMYLHSSAEKAREERRKASQNSR